MVLVTNLVEIRQKAYLWQLVAIAQSVYRLAAGWTDRGSNPCGGRDFRQPFRPALGLTQLQWVPGLSRR
jgi:hypothetical protein